MLGLDGSLSPSMLSLLLKRTLPRRQLQQIHSQLILTGCTYRPFLNALIRHSSLGAFPQHSLLIFKHLCSSASSFFSNSFTYLFLLKACTNLRNFNCGIQIHARTFKSGFESNLYVQTSLVEVYAACGFLSDAHHLFERMPQRSSVTWNVLVTGLVRFGSLGAARSLFDRMPDHTTVTWTVLIEGYARDNPREALALFQRMVVGDGLVKPNEVTMLAVLHAISSIGSLPICQCIHTYTKKCGLFTKSPEIHVSNSLIDTYAKCGCMRSASRVFEELSPETRTLVSWTAIVSGYAMQGMAKEAVENFERMERAGVEPNRVTFLSILNACSHGGLDSEGLKFFHKMIGECRVSPDIKHYGCLVDMLARAGRLEEAEKIALEIPSEIDNVVIWRTILGACSFHGYVEMGQRVTRRIKALEGTRIVDYVLLSNIYTGAGRFDDAERVRKSIDESNLCKCKGLSLV